MRRARGGSRVLAAASALGAVWASAQSPPPLVFRSQVEAVYVDVFVTRNGEPVSGLREADFELRDNGVPQQLELVAAASQPLLAVLVLDTSSSMEGEKLQALKAAAREFLDGLRPADQAGLIAFSENIAWRAGPGADKAEVRRALDRLGARGATALYDALYAAIALSETELRPLLVLFSDGEDNASWLDGPQLERLAERSNALIHVVGLVSVPRTFGPAAAGPPEREYLRPLKRIAELSGGRLWQAEAPGRLREAFAAIADAMGHRYVLRYEPGAVRREGWHRLEVRLTRGPRADVHARRGYWVAR